MSITRSSLRAAAGLAAAAALTVSAAGVASAASTSYEVEGNELAVTFTKEGTTDVAVCFAAATPTAGAAALIGQIEGATSGDIQAILDLIDGSAGVTILKTDELIPNALPSVAISSQTVYATLEPNVYTLISRCTGSDLVVNPGVLVGDPNEAVAGSINMLSSDGDALGILSSTLGGGDADAGAFGTLSSALGETEN